MMVEKALRNCLNAFSKFLKDSGLVSEDVKLEGVFLVYWSKDDPESSYRIVGGKFVPKEVFAHLLEAQEELEEGG